LQALAGQISIVVSFPQVEISSIEKCQ
jgi:hypothetical protein